MSQNNNISGVNMATPAVSSVNVNTLIATSLTTILKEVEIIISANKQYLKDLGGIRKKNPQKYRMKRQIQEIKYRSFNRHALQNQ